MEINHTILVTLFLLLIVVNSAGTDLEAKGDPNTGLASSISNQNNTLNVKKGESDLVLDSNTVDPVKKGRGQVDKSKEGVENTNLDKSSSSKQLESKEDQTVQTNKIDNGSLNEGKKKEKAGEGSESKEVAKEGTLLPVRKENFRVEECDSSNMCKDDKAALVACLRVPGNESPDLSLLIQNKGKGPLTVTVSAPDFVQLEKTQIQLQEKEDKKVKVSIKNGAAGSFIVLTAGNGNCSLDFRDLIVQNSRKEVDYTSQSTYINLLRRTPYVVFIILVVLLVMASIWTCVSFRRRYFGRDGSKYQKIDMDFPVSGGSKTMSESNDGWDNSWDDNWDDEEAPKTPSMPITPSLSAKGISSRRFNKEAWKD